MSIQPNVGATSVRTLPNSLRGPIRGSRWSKFNVVLNAGVAKKEGLQADTVRSLASQRNTPMENIATQLEALRQQLAPLFQGLVEIASSAEFDRIIIILLILLLWRALSARS